MNPKALQWAPVDITRMDNATFLSFCNNVDEKCQADGAAPMRTTMGQFYTDFHAACVLYDDVFNPARKSLDTEDLKTLDAERDNSLGAYHEAVLGLQRNPNEAKKQAARLLNLNYDTYKPSASQEYMKETELIQQMTTAIRASQELTAAVTLLGLGDYLDDLEQKNAAFAQLMKSRTASTEGQTKGAVANARADLEKKYQLLRQMLNVASIYEGDTQYRPFLLAVNAVVEHYRQILARKGVTTGGGSSSGTGDASGTGGTGGTTTDPAQGGTTDPGTTTDPSTGGGSTDPDPSQGGSTDPGTDPGTGGGGSSDDDDDITEE